MIALADPGVTRIPNAMTNRSGLAKTAFLSNPNNSCNYI
jgi:hypothetical protein